MTHFISVPPHESHTVNDLNTEFGFGYYETQGRRREQEDALAWHVLDANDLTSKDHPQQLSPEEIAHRLWTSYQILDTPDLAGGTTASTTIYDGQGNFITATLADAASFAAVYDKEGNVLGVTRLNSITHKPTDKTENDRIIQAGGFVSWGRVNGSLAVSRAIGDQYLKKAGVSSEATIDISSREKIANDLNIDLSKIGSIQIINTCDGFTDGAGEDQSKGSHEKYLLAILHKMQAPGKLAQNKLAEHLAEQAIIDGSGDNVTVAVQTITEQTPPVFVGVYDGHGCQADHTNGASIRVAQNIGRVFKKQCALTQEQYAQQELSAFRKKDHYLADNKDPDLEAMPSIQVQPEPQPSTPVVTVVDGDTKTPAQQPEDDKTKVVKTSKPVKRVLTVEQEGQLANAIDNLTKLTTEYQSTLGKSKHKQLIEPVVLELGSILNSSKPNEEKLKEFYQYLDEQHATGVKNIDVIKEDKRVPTANYLWGVAIIAATILTGIIPGVLIMAVVYAATGKTPADLLKETDTPGKRFEGNVQGLKPGFFSTKPNSETPGEDPGPTDNPSVS